MISISQRSPFPPVCLLTSDLTCSILKRAVVAMASRSQTFPPDNVLAAAARFDSDKTGAQFDLWNIPQSRSFWNTDRRSGAHFFGPESIL